MRVIGGKRAEDASNQILDMPACLPACRSASLWHQAGNIADGPPGWVGNSSKYVMLGKLEDKVAAEYKEQSCLNCLPSAPIKISSRRGALQM
jgi:hypothetical protein